MLANDVNRTSVGVLLLVLLVSVVGAAANFETLPPKVYASSGTAYTVGSSSKSPAYPYPIERNAFYANGLGWVFYFDGLNIGYSTSSDGMTWSPETIAIGADGSSSFSVVYDGATYLFITWLHGLGGGNYHPTVDFRMGVPNPDGSITWVATAAVVDSSCYSGCGSPSITMDASGHAYVAFFDNRVNGGSTYTVRVVKNSKVDGTWVTASGFPIDLASNSGGGTYYPSITSFGNEIVVAWSYSGGGKLGIRSYTGSAWNTVISSGSTSAANPYFSIVGGSGTAHITYLTSGNAIVDDAYSYSANGVIETIVQSGVTQTSAPTVSLDPSTGNAYVIWAGSPVANHVYFKHYVSGTGWDASPTDWLTESPLTTNFVNAYPIQISGIAGIVDSMGSTSPYSVRFSVATSGPVTPPPPTVSVTTTTETVTTSACTSETITFTVTRSNGQIITGTLTFTC